MADCRSYGEGIDAIALDRTGSPRSFHGRDAKLANKSSVAAAAAPHITERIAGIAGIEKTYHEDT
jgi:hypothetical protein